MEEESKDGWTELPEWLRELWEIKPALARKAEAAYRAEKERADKVEGMLAEGRKLARDSYDAACKQKARAELAERHYAELVDLLLSSGDHRDTFARHESERKELH
jgi:hypothetical protein